MASGTEQPLISVVLPTYNRQDHIEAAIESVLQQTFSGWELLITDDGSSDNTRQISERFALRDERIKLFSIPHAGVSAARNHSLLAANGHVVTYLDADNCWREGYLDSVWQTLELAINACCYHAMQLHIQQPNGNEATMRRMFNQFDRDKLLRRNQIDLNTFAHTRDLYVANGGFDEQLSRLCDWDLIIRYTAKTTPIAVDLIGADYYHHSAANRISVANNFSLNAIRVALKSHHPTPNRFILVAENSSPTELDALRTQGIECRVTTKADFADLALRRSDIVLWYESSADQQLEFLQQASKKLDHGCALSFYMFGSESPSPDSVATRRDIAGKFHFFVAQNAAEKIQLQNSIDRADAASSPNQHDRIFLRDASNDDESCFENALQRIVTHHYPERHKQLKVAIGIQMLSTEDPLEWGDYAYASHLRDSFCELGLESRVVYRDQTLTQTSDADVFLHLFGINYPLLPAKNGQLRCLWIISHIDKLDPYLSAQFDIIFCASKSYTEELRRNSPGLRVQYLPQSTDPNIFSPLNADASENYECDLELGFVGNARGVTRPMIEQASTSERKLAVWGRGWDGVLNREVWRDGLLTSEQVADVYRRSRVVLNDHWDDQREHGIVNNRIFDALSCGSAILSDENPGLEHLFSALPTFSPRDLQHEKQEQNNDKDAENVVEDTPDIDHAITTAIEHCNSVNYREVILNRHTFSHRIRTMLCQFGQLLGKQHGSELALHQYPRICFLTGTADASTTRKRAIEMIEMLNGQFIVHAHSQRDFEPEQILGSDIIVLQRWTGMYGNKVQRLLSAMSALRPLGKQFIYDIDDLILHRANELPRKLISACDAVLCSTAALRKHILPWNDAVYVAENVIDHRHYIGRQRERDTDAPVRVSVVSTDGAGYELVCRLADRFNKEDSVDLEFCFVTLDSSLDVNPAVDIIHDLNVDELTQHLFDSDIALNIGEMPEPLIEKLQLRLFNIDPNDFLNCKSGIKYFDAALAGLPFVTTPMPTEYSRLIENGATGLLVDDEKKCFDTLMMLAKSPQRRREIGLAAREHVLRERSFLGKWESVRKLYLQLNKRRLNPEYQLLAPGQSPLQRPTNGEIPALLQKQHNTLQLANQLSLTELGRRQEVHRLETIKSHTLGVRLGNAQASIKNAKEGIAIRQNNLEIAKKEVKRLQNIHTTLSRKVGLLERDNRHLSEEIKDWKSPPRLIRRIFRSLRIRVNQHLKSRRKS